MDMLGAADSFGKNNSHCVVNCHDIWNISIYLVIINFLRYIRICIYQLLVNLG